LTLGARNLKYVRSAAAIVDEHRILPGEQTPVILTKLEHSRYVTRTREATDKIVSLRKQA